MTTTHTPGPWKVAKRTTPGQFVTEFHIVAERDDHIALVGPCEVEGNANLIAAAPAMLAVLADLVSMYERGYVQGVSTATGGAFLDSILSARAAIAAAKGGAQ